jgi:hypothetical protein
MFKTHRTYDLSTGVKNNSIAVLNNSKGLFVTYHKTTVYEQQGKKITLRSGGWDTISTRAVINRALEAMGIRMTLTRIVIKKQRYTILKDIDNNIELPFIDGMVIKL